MNKRSWVPADYLDEICPTPRAHPTDWLIVDESGGHRIAAAFPDEDGATPGDLLADGEIVLFNWTVECGSGHIIVGADGSTSVNFVATAPEGATLMYWFPGDPDTIVEDPAEWKDGYGVGDEITTGNWVKAYAWGNADVAFRYDQATGTFIEHGSVQ